MTEIEPGTYRHFKGGIYEVLGVARHSETEEQLVVYQNDSNQFWVRPYAMFVESVEHEGQVVKRFEKLPPEPTVLR